MPDDDPEEDQITSQNPTTVGPEPLEPRPGDDSHPDTRPYDLRAEISRKGLHVLVVALPLAVLAVGKDTVLPPLVGVTVIALLADILRSRYDGCERFVQTVFGFMMRSSEKASDGKITVNGATWVLLSLTVLLLVFPAEVAVAGFISFTIGDAAAALVGRAVGSHNWPGSSRTVEGSIAFIVAGGIVLSAFPASDPTTNAIAIVAGAAAEVFSERIDDNVLVPFAISLVLWSLPPFLV